MDTAAELEAIRRLKYAYFRTLDLKEFDELGALLTEDATAATRTARPVLEGRAAIVSWLRSVLADPGIVTEHHGHHPEFTFTSDTEAQGTWYLQDRVIVPSADVEIGGTAFYEDRYRRTRRGLAHRTHGLYPGLRGTPHPLDAGRALLYISLRLAGLKVKPGSKSVVGASACSMASTKSGSSSTSSALTFSAICSGRLAPTIALQTFWFCNTHASATGAGVYPASRHRAA